MTRDDVPANRPPIHLGWDNPDGLSFSVSAQRPVPQAEWDRMMAALAIMHRVAVVSLVAVSRGASATPEKLDEMIDKIRRA